MKSTILTTSVEIKACIKAIEACNLWFPETSTIYLELESGCWRLSEDELFSSKIYVTMIGRSLMGRSRVQDNWEPLHIGIGSSFRVVTQE